MSDRYALATWLRLGTIEAESQECSEFRKSSFKRKLPEIRSLTKMPIGEALATTKRLCNQSGVALALIKPFPKTALSGAAWWLTPRKAVIQLSARHKSDDHLWFSFFHEAAHLLLHSKKGIFIDEIKGAKTGAEEVEANEWAANALVPDSDLEELVSEFSCSEQCVRDFADRQGIAPGIVVGMLQHRGAVPWSRLNRLKIRLEWSEQ